ncbi:MAG: ABC transporter permease [Rhodospirillaceae bacterium]|nr:ABC transporter permease [Rhodospirillaceae bacterium]MCA8933429.1 ABC transporter permease [Rhodospirillaceae bacterium]
MLALAFGQLLRRRVRTGLTAGGVFIAIAGLVGLTTLVNGAQHAWGDGLGRFGADILVYEWGALDPYNGSLPAEMAPQIAGIDDVAGVHPVIMRLATFQPGDAQTVLVGHAADAPLWQDMHLISGAAPGAADRWGAVLGAALARAAEAEAGGTVSVLFHDLTVTGVVETGSQLGDHAVHVLLADAAELLFLGDAVSFFAVTVEAGADPQRVAEGISAAITRVTAAPRSDVVSGHQLMALLQALSWSVSFVALLTGVALVATTMMMSVTERRPDLALLKCLGWSHRRVVGLVLLEAVVIGGIAGAAGTAAGFAAASAIGSLDSVATFIDPQPTFGVGVTGLAAALVTCLAGGVLPALTALGIRPAAVIAQRRL